MKPFFAHLVVFCSALMLSAAASAQTPRMHPSQEGVLERFYRENDGKYVRRLPTWIMPQPSTLMLSNDDLQEDFKGGVHDRVLDLFQERSDLNLITYALRCIPDLSTPEIERRAAETAVKAREAGINLMMNIDPRIMRNEFFDRWPEDCMHWRQFEVVKPDSAGTAHFKVELELLRDHKCYGKVPPYSWWKPARLVSVRAIRNGDPATARFLTAEEVDTTTHFVSGVVRGLAPDETLLAEADFPLKEIDPCSPHLLPFMREMMLRYQKLGLSGSYLDEWGFLIPRTTMRELRAFWHSDYFARDYAAHSGGRDLEKDLPFFTLKVNTPEIYAAVNAYLRTIYDRCREMEEFHYSLNKELFGPDAFVGIHPTWIPNPGWPAEYFHDGLDWWVAKRDWAQTDESTPISIDTGLAKKFGSPLWLNQAYSEELVDYIRALWQYSLCGGRMNWHGITNTSPTEPGKGGHLVRNYQTASERSYHRLADLHDTTLVRADEILRLLPLMTRASIDCPVAQIFGHERIVNWLDPAYCDWGKDLSYGLGSRGYYTDAYPASEIAEETFSVDADGCLRVGCQRYPVVLLHHLSASERIRWEAFAKANKMGATRVFVNPSVKEVAAYLDSVQAVKQTPLGKTGFRGNTRNLLPPSDGVLRLNDGTVARIKGGHPDDAGDLIEGEIEVGGIVVKYQARGMFAARAENGGRTGIAGGEVTRIEAPGISLSLSKPADLALVKLSDGWHGVWQTDDPSARVPKPLRKLTRKWVKLHGL